MGKLINSGAGPAYLILMVTDQCNLSCRYCYLGEHKKVPGLGNTMTPALLDRAVDLAAEGRHPFHVQISGGEPLLVPAMVAHGARRIRQLVPSATVGIQTNGSCLDEAAVDMIREYDLKPGISLDGDPPVQEALRGNAAGTFRGLALLEQHGIPFNVTTVVSSANVNSLHRLVMVLGGMSMARGIGLDLLVTKGRAATDALTPATPAGVRAGVKKMMGALDMVNRGRSIPLVVREMEKIREHRPSDAPFCHAARGRSLAVTPEGHLFPCSQTAYDPRFFLGSLDRPGSWRRSNLMKPKGLTRTLGRDAARDCTDCPLEGRCPGDCPSRLYYNRNRVPDAACALYRTLAEPNPCHAKLGI